MNPVVLGCNLIRQTAFLAVPFCLYLTAEMHHAGFDLMWQMRRLLLIEGANQEIKAFVGLPPTRCASRSGRR
jgi:hypothetical protein